jgi:hypothetical protein
MGRRGRAITIGILGILIGAMAHTLTVNVALSLLAQPFGARIRIMGEATVPIYAALIGVCGGAVSLMAVRQAGTRGLGIIGLVPNLLPFPLGVILIRYVVQLRHLVDLP